MPRRQGTYLDDIVLAAHSCQRANIGQQATKERQSAADRYRMIAIGIAATGTSHYEGFLDRSRSRGCDSGHGHGEEGEDGVELHFECWGARAGKI